MCDMFDNLDLYEAVSNDGHTVLVTITYEMAQDINKQAGFSQKTFFDNYEYYLPSQINLLKESKSQIDSKTGEFRMTVGDWYVATQKFVPYNK
jgi:hypothetical protein